HDVVGIAGEGDDGPAASASNLVQERVRRDPAQPTLHRPRLVGDQPPAYSKQHLLHEILRVILVARQAEGHGVQEPPVIAGDLFPRGDVTIRHQNDVGSLAGSNRHATAIASRSSGDVTENGTGPSFTTR